MKDDPHKTLIALRMDNAIIEALDDFRQKHRVWNRSEAIRLLLKHVLSDAKQLDIIAKQRGAA